MNVFWVLNKNHINETVLLGNHSICYGWEIRKKKKNSVTHFSGGLESFLQHAIAYTAIIKYSIESNDFLPAHPASFTHNFVSGMQSFYSSESQGAMVSQTYNVK